MTIIENTTSTTTSSTDTIYVSHLTDQAPQGVSELVHVPAANVAIENNIRTVADLDKGFLASIKRHGILLPVIGYRDESGRIVVRDGQMRVLAALEVGITVPVLVTERETTDAKRVTEQLVANEQRTALSTGDRLAAYRQLELSGMSEAAIARETGTKRDVVKKTLTVAKSEAATDAIVSGQVSFDTALILAEFEGDAAALEQLRTEIDNGWEDELAHTAERIRQDRARTAAVAALTVEWEANGVRVVTDDEGQAIRHFTDADDDADERPPLDTETHASCPGRAVTFSSWGVPEPIEVCTTPEAHHALYRYAVSAARVPAAERTEEQRDEAKAERRTLIANNKAWDAAEVVRREWVATLLQRKTLPKDAARFVGTALTRHGFTMRNNTGTQSAHGLLGLAGNDYESQVADWLDEHPTKGGHVSLAVVLAAFENDSNRTWWRDPFAMGKAYLSQIEAWGYHLTEVERIAAGHPATDSEPVTE